MSQTHDLTQAFDEIAKPFLKSFTMAADDLVGGGLKLDVTTVVLYANASLCQSGATLKLALQTSPDGVTWYGTGAELTISSSALKGRTVLQHCGFMVRAVSTYGGTGVVTLAALTLEGMPK